MTPENAFCCNCRVPKNNQASTLGATTFSFTIMPIFPEIAWLTIKTFRSAPEYIFTAFHDFVDGHFKKCKPCPWWPSPRCLYLFHCWLPQAGHPFHNITPVIINTQWDQLRQIRWEVTLKPGQKIVRSEISFRNTKKIPEYWFKRTD